MQVPFQVPLEVNIVLVGMNGDGGYRYAMDPHKLEEFLRVSFSTHRPSCQETGEPLDIEHRLVYNVFPVSILFNLKPLFMILYYFISIGMLYLSFWIVNKLSNVSCGILILLELFEVLHLESDCYCACSCMFSVISVIDF